MAELSTVARPYAEALFAAARDDQAGLAGNHGIRDHRIDEGFQRKQDALVNRTPGEAVGRCRV